MLRHIYLTGKYGDELKERQKDANMMGHTTDMASDYIKTKQIFFDYYFKISRLDFYFFISV